MKSFYTAASMVMQQRLLACPCIVLENMTSSIFSVVASAQHNFHDPQGNHSSLYAGEMKLLGKIQFLLTVANGCYSNIFNGLEIGAWGWRGSSYLAFPLALQVGTPDCREGAGVTAEPWAVWSDLTPSATTGPRCPLCTRPGAGWAWLWWEEWSMPLEVTAEISLLFLHEC